MTSQQYEESMDIDSPLPVSLGLQEEFNIQMSAEDLVLLEDLDLQEFMLSPSPLNGTTQFDELSDIEPNTPHQPNRSQFSPGTAALDQQSPFMPTLGAAPSPQAVPVVPHTSQTYAVSTTTTQVLGDMSETMQSLDDIEPMRLLSGDMRDIVMQDPSALNESFGSVELIPSRQASRADQVQRRNAPAQPTPQQNAQVQHVPQQNTPAQLTPDSRTVSRRQSRDGRRSRDGHETRDGSQRQRQSRSSPDSTTPAEPKPYYSDFKFPDSHHFKVSVKFMSTPVMSQKIISPGGCLLYYRLPGQSNALVPVDEQMERVPVTTKITNRGEDGSVSERDFPWINDKQKRFTEKILTSFDRGLVLFTKDGDIYAKRRSNTKLMWHSTQQEPGHALELVREQSTKVFDLKEFRENLTAHYRQGTQKTVKLPAIWFSFGQKWDTDSSKITTKLVWARVDPICACEMVRAANPDVEDITLAESLHSNSLAISHDSRQAMSSN